MGDDDTVESLRLQLDIANMTLENVRASAESNRQDALKRIREYQTANVRLLGWRTIAKRLMVAAFGEAAGFADDTWDEAPPIEMIENPTPAVVAAARAELLSLAKDIDRRYET